MTKHPTHVAPPPPGAHRQSDRDLLAGLGLTEHASSRDVESAHDRIVAFLEAAPTELHTWARGEIAAADEAYALLASPTPRPQPDAIPHEAQRQPGDAGGAGDLPPAAPGAFARVWHSPKRRRIAMAATVLAVAVAVVGVYRMGGGSGAPKTVQAPVSNTPAVGQVDKERVAELTRKIAANPKDVASFIRLGDLYFQAGDYASAADWMGRAVKLRPADVTARLALGAAWFNLGKSKNAEKQWRRTVTIDPKNVEARYDLGFLYLSANPPNMARVRAEWGKVIELAPRSQVAKTVAAHLEQIDKQSSASTEGRK